MAPLRPARLEETRLPLPHGPGPEVEDDLIGERLVVGCFGPEAAQRDVAKPDVEGPLKAPRRLALLEVPALLCPSFARLPRVPSRAIAAAGVNPDGLRRLAIGATGVTTPMVGQARRGPVAVEVGPVHRLRYCR